MSEMDWRHRAVCRDYDPELWFPIGEGAAYHRQIDEAKAVCRRCPVASWCLAEAMLKPSVTEGVWGGTTQGERQQMARRSRRGARADAGDRVLIDRAAKDRDVAVSMDERDKRAAIHEWAAEGQSPWRIASRLKLGTETVRRVLGGDRA